VRRAHDVHRLVTQRGDGGRRQAAVLQAKGHFVSHGEGAELILGVLLHQPHHVGYLKQRVFADVQPRHPHHAVQLPAELVMKIPPNGQGQGRLATAAWAAHGDELALTDVERDVAERGTRGIRVIVGQVVDIDHRDDA